MEEIELEKLELPPMPNRPLPNQRTYLAPLFLRVACPSCGKLYRIDSRDIHSSQPHFECLACLTLFSFAYPNPKPLKVVAKVIRPSVQPLEGRIESRPVDVKTCPKCSALNARGAKECRRCTVIFAKVENLPLDPKLGARPSLVRAWQELMDDYENLSKHWAFVDQCEDLRAIPFALKKYSDLKVAQPQDHIAQEMLHRVLARKFALRANRIKKIQFIRQSLSRLNWVRIRKAAPWALSLALILIGVTQPAFRNFAGIGASVLFVTVGLRLFLAGEFRLSDYW